MELRDKIAIAALSSLIENRLSNLLDYFTPEESFESLAECSYSLADEMLKARSKVNANE